MIIIDNIKYSLKKDINLVNDQIPLTWWAVAPNFGDLLAPYLIEKLTSIPVKHVDLKPGNRRKPILSKRHNSEKSYFSIGSIVSRTNSNSIVWGAGTFGTEGESDLKNNATYLAVRGPLTRNLLRIHGSNCPEIYGDPALLIPKVFNPSIKKTHKVGIILRWPELDWNKTNVDPNIKKIILGTGNIEGTITEILSCEKILSSSLHGIILADAYNIPSAWLRSNTPKGLEHKFYDYFLSVNKMQQPQEINFSTKELTLTEVETNIYFDDKKIEFNAKKLLDACPFIEETT